MRAGTQACSGIDAEPAQAHAGATSPSRPTKSSPRSAEWQHLYCSQPAFRCGEKVRRPCVECNAFLLCPIVPLINPNYASPTSAQRIQHRLGDLKAHAEALQPCRYCPAQIMQPPTGNTGCAIKL